MKEGRQAKYQTPSREKALAAEIARILVTSNGNMPAFLKGWDFSRLCDLK